MVTVGQFLLQPGTPVAIDRRSQRELRRCREAISAPFIHRPSPPRLLMAAVLLVGPCRLSAPAGGAAAADRFSDDHGQRVAAGRLARNDGLVGRAAAGASDRANPRRFADDLDEFARRDRDQRAVRPRSQHRRRRQRHPGGDQRRVRAIAEGPAEPADLSQGQPLGHADPHPLRPLGRRADHRRRRRRRKHSRPAHQPDLAAFRWCASAASSSRRSASRSTRPSWSRRTCSSRTCARRSRSPPSTIPRARSTATKQSFTIFDNDQLTEAKPWNDVIVAYRNGAPVRVRDIGVAVAGPADTTQAAWSNGKRGVFLVVFKQPGVNVIKTVESIKTVAGQAGGGDSARHPRRRSLPTAPRRSAPRSRTCNSRCADHRARRDGDIRVPAQRLGDHHPERHRAARAARRLRADVGGRLQPRQSVADGADHRGRLRRRRRDRDARKHHAPRRGGR